MYQIAAACPGGNGWTGTQGAITAADAGKFVSGFYEIVIEDGFNSAGTEVFMNVWLTQSTTSPALEAEQFTYIAPPDGRLITVLVPVTNLAALNSIGATTSLGIKVFVSFQIEPYRWFGGITCVTHVRPGPQPAPCQL